MFNIGHIIPIICFWNSILKETLKYRQESTAKNIVHLIHSLIFILHHNYNYNIDYATHISIGFYAYDLMYIISSILKMKTKNEFIKHFPYVIHHLIAIYILNASFMIESKQILLGGYNILEMSNIMLYVSHHVHKEYNDRLKMNAASEFIQLLWYSYFRIIQFFSFSYQHKISFFNFNFTTQMVIIIIYFMGIIWSCKLTKKNINNYHKLKQLYYKTTTADD
jgi:hypothetical protein